MGVRGGPMSLWHDLWCRFLDRNTVRETVDGVLGFRCDCGEWTPAVTRTPEERERFASIRPAHETLVIRKKRKPLFRRSA